MTKVRSPVARAALAGALIGVLLTTSLLTLIFPPAYLGGAAREDSPLATPTPFDPQQKPDRSQNKERPKEGSLDEHVRRCRRVARDLPQAQVIHDQDVRTVVGSAVPVRAAVTLKVALPADIVLPPRAGTGTSTERVRVSCRLEAALNGDPTGSEVSPGGWQRQSFLTDETVRWIWLCNQNGRE